MMTTPSGSQNGTVYKWRNLGRCYIFLFRPISSTATVITVNTILYIFKYVYTVLEFSPVGPSLNCLHHTMSFTVGFQPCVTQLPEFASVKILTSLLVCHVFLFFFFILKLYLSLLLKRLLGRWSVWQSCSWGMELSNSHVFNRRGGSRCLTASDGVTY